MQRDYSGDLLKRIDEHLEILPRHERRKFLGQQLEKWTENFQRWQRLVDSGESTARFGDACALDFHLTLIGIQKRIAKEMEQAA